MSGDRIDLLAKIEMLEKENKELLDKVDYYKHEYFSMCDLNEELQKEDKNAIKSPSFFINAYYDRIKYNLVGRKIEEIEVFIKINIIFFRLKKLMMLFCQKKN